MNTIRTFAARLPRTTRTRGRLARALCGNEPPTTGEDDELPRDNLLDEDVAEHSAVSEGCEEVDIFALGRGGFTLDEMLRLYGRAMPLVTPGHQRSIR